MSNWGSLTYGIIFLSVLAEYIGLPVPSSMVLIVAGALAFQGQVNALLVFFLALVAAVCGDALWFYFGRIKGDFLLAGYCKWSLGSRDCVRRTKDLFLRFPRTSLLLGKFIPGLSTFVVPVAGLSGMRYPQFFRDDGGGIILWASLMIALGYVWGEWINAYIKSVEHAKWILVTAALTLLVGYYGIKIWRVKKFGRADMGEAT